MASKIISMKKGKNEERAERQAIANAMALAEQHGYMHVNDEERAMLEALHWTSFKGRDMVFEFARFIRRQHPWDDKAELARLKTN